MCKYVCVYLYVYICLCIYTHIERHPRDRFEIITKKREKKRDLWRRFTMKATYGLSDLRLGMSTQKREL